MVVVGRVSMVHAAVFVGGERASPLTPCQSERRENWARWVSGGGPVVVDQWVVVCCMTRHLKLAAHPSISGSSPRWVMLSPSSRIFGYCLDLGLGRCL